MRGYRKLVVFAACLVGLVGGLAVAKDSSMYTPFAAAVVGIGGWFFKANVDAKETPPTPVPEAKP